MKKSKRIDLRLTPEEKQFLKQQAQEHDMTVSEYIWHCIINNAGQKTHEQQITDSLAENHILNSLLLHPDLNNKSKKIITREMKQYV